MYTQVLQLLVHNFVIYTVAFFTGLALYRHVLRISLVRSSISKILYFFEDPPSMEPATEEAVKTADSNDINQSLTSNAWSVSKTVLSEAWTKLPYVFRYTVSPPSTGEIQQEGVEFPEKNMAHQSIYSTIRSAAHDAFSSTWTKVSGYFSYAKCTQPTTETQTDGAEFADRTLAQQSIYATVRSASHGATSSTWTKVSGYFRFANEPPQTSQQEGDELSDPNNLWRSMLSTVMSVAEISFYKLPEFLNTAFSWLIPTADDISSSEMYEDETEELVYINPIPETTAEYIARLQNIRNEYNEGSHFLPMTPSEDDPVGGIKVLPIHPLENQPVLAQPVITKPVKPRMRSWGFSVNEAGNPPPPRKLRSGTIYDAALLGTNSKG